MLMTDQEFMTFCAEHPDVNFEMTAQGELIVIPPTHSDTGCSNFEVTGQLGNWASQDRRGYGCDSSFGLVLPNGARRSPDASWTLKTGCGNSPTEAGTPSGMFARIL